MQEELHEDIRAGTLDFVAEGECKIMMPTQGNLLADPGEGANEIVQDCSVKDRKNGSYVSMGLGKTLRHAWLFLVGGGQRT